MPKKSRTPDPPRRPVQAPKARPGVTRTPEEVRKFRILLLVGASGIVALTVVIGIILVSSGGSSKVNDAGLAATLAKAGCTLKTYPGLARTHVSDLTAKVKYKSFPPTSGPHYFKPALWGAYDAPVNELQAVHNLEHGGILINYGDKVPASTVDQLTGFYRKSPNALLMFPLPRLGDKIALTAWTHLAECRRFDEKAFEAFRDAYRGKGPERIPVSVLKPGT